MSAKDWAVPLVAAAVTFAGLSFLPEDGPAVNGPVPSTILLPFPDHVVSDRTTHVLLVDRERQHSTGVQAFTDWKTPHVGIGTTSAILEDCDCVGPMWHVAAPADAPRLGVGGYNATRLTVHVFDEDGELFASNAADSEQERLSGKYGPEQLPSGVWYLGADGAAPPGTRKPPLVAQVFLGQARSLLAGMPVGGVVTTQTDLLADSVGTLYITARVDELVLAP